MASKGSFGEFYDKHFDTERFMMEFMSPDSEIYEDFIKKPLQLSSKIFGSEDLKGDTLILYGASLAIHGLFHASAKYKNVIIVEFAESSFNFINTWLDRGERAFHWTPSLMSAFESESERKALIEMKEHLKKSVKEVIRGEVNESELVPPKTLPQADCICSAALGYASKDLDSFTNGVKSMSSLLKVGGHLLMNVMLNATYMHVGGTKFPVLSLDEEIVKGILREQGFEIKETHVIPRVNISKKSVMDFGSMFYVVASKTK